MINRAWFFKTVREKLYHSKNMSLKQPTVIGFNKILDVWEIVYPEKDDRWLAYALATAYHETAFRMEPIEEYGKGKGREYGIPDPETGHIYYGRGYVQLTWKRNYELFGIADIPQRALEHDKAAYIMFQGMMNGSFTGKKLSDYISGDKCDFVNARKIINGLDKAEQIAKYAETFYCALSYTT